MLVADGNHGHMCDRTPVNQTAKSVGPELEKGGRHVAEYVWICACGRVFAYGFGKQYFFWEKGETNCIGSVGKFYLYS